MSATRGYYSLIQYCPDLSRLEAFNVGVILFCPDAKFIEARTSAGNDKLRRVFGSENVDGERLNAAKAAIEARLENDRDAFRELADLERFVQTRANQMLLTSPRPIKVSSPENDLDRIYKELVGGRARKEPKKPKFPALDAVFKQLAEQGRARLKHVVTIPTINRQLTVPYAYKNGIWNLVKPQTFVLDEKRATDVAMKLAVEGDLLQKHTRKTSDESKLIVVSAFDDQSPASLRNQIFELLREYNVKPVAPDELTDFTKKIQQEAHC